MSGYTSKDEDWDTTPFGEQKIVSYRYPDGRLEEWVFMSVANRNIWPTALLMKRITFRGVTTIKRYGDEK